MSTPSPTHRTPHTATPSARAGKLRLALIGGGGLSCIVISFATLYYFIASGQSTQAPPPKLATAFELLDSGQHVAAREAAERIQAGRQLAAHEYGAPAYIIGATLLHEADETIDPGDRAQRFLVASRYLERARERGFPAGRETEGLLLLGRSLHESGEYSAAIVALQELAKTSAALKPTADRLLASCYLRSDPPQLDSAVQHAECVLAAPHLSPADREDAQLLYGETLLARRDFVRCAELVAQIPSSSPLYPQAMLFKGRSLLAAAEAVTAQNSREADASATAGELYKQAIDALRQVHIRRAADHAVARESMYLIGVGLRGSGNLPAAQGQFLRVRKTHYASAEGIAASLQSAEIAAELRDPQAALTGYKYTLDQINDSPSLVNPWVSQKKMQKRLAAGYQAFLDNGQYALAIELAKALAPPFDEQRAVQLVAAAHEQWGGSLQHAAARDASAKGQAMQADARRQFRAAAAAYARVAEMNVTSRRYTDELWLAGKNYAAGHDFRRAIAHYERYLGEESKRQRPAVLVKLAEAQLSLDRVDAAIATCNECIQAFPKDPAAYHARLLASRAYREKNDIAAAKAMLEANLHHESLTPRSDVWRDSLFAIGALLCDEGQMKQMEHHVAQQSAASGEPPTASLEAGHAALHEAQRYLSEAISRYPNDPQATQARFQVAEAHRQSARLPLAKLQTESIESRRAALNAQVQQELQAGLAAYDELATLLNRRADEGPLSPVEQSILRNTYFARGGVLYDLGQFEQAIQAYSTATNRYQNEPAAVEAYVQIASCYRRLNKPLEARGTIEQAKLVMARMPEAADFTKTTRFARDEWTTLLDWLSGT